MRYETIQIQNSLQFDPKIDLEEEWQDGLPATGVVLELPFVVTVFAGCPYCHLIEASSSEHQCWKRQKYN